MRTLHEILAHPSTPQLLELEIGIDGFAAMASRPGRRLLRVVASWGGGWDHVSVSTRPGSAPPTWDEMDGIARAFFHDDEVPVQFHVGGAAKVNRHPNCLHLWLQHGRRTELPPRDFV